MADRKISLNELSERVGITPANLSNLKNAKVSAVKLSTMEAICKALTCQPGDLFEYSSSDIFAERPGELFNGRNHHE
jgi:Predicted transcriptional regulator